VGVAQYSRGERSAPGAMSDARFKSSRLERASRFAFSQHLEYTTRSLGAPKGRVLEAGRRVHAAVAGCSLSGVGSITSACGDFEPNKPRHPRRQRKPVRKRRRTRMAGCTSWMACFRPVRPSRLNASLAPGESMRAANSRTSSSTIRTMLRERCDCPCSRSGARCALNRCVARRRECFVLGRSAT
jgi:hypothetical protein